MSKVPTHIILGGATLPLAIRRHPRSRHITLRYQPLTHSVLLMLPKRTAIADGLRFLRERERWLTRQIDEVSAVQLVDGAVISVLGTRYALHHEAVTRGVVRIEGEVIHIPGEAAYFKRRLTDWLKKIAKEEMT